MEEIKTVYQLLKKIMPITNQFDMPQMGSLLCMLMEEWCRANDENIVEFVNELQEVVGQVEEACGKY